MRISTIFLTTASLAMMATSASAAPAPASKKARTAEAPASVVPKIGVAGPPDVGAILGLFDKIFPPQPEPDPARLALARTSATAMWPDGTYGRMMTKFMGGIVDRVMQLKGSDFAQAVGEPQKPGATPAKDLSIHDSAMAKDPYFDQRVAAIRAVVTDEFGKISAVVDPRMRDGLARAVARRFDAQQLNDINRFFATPTGQAFAGQYVDLLVDPDTIRSMFSSMPELMKLMPELQQRIKAADDKFPKPPKAKFEVKETPPPPAKH